MTGPALWVCMTNAGRFITCVFAAILPVGGQCGETRNTRRCHWQGQLHQWTGECDKLSAQLHVKKTYQLGKCRDHLVIPAAPGMVTKYPEKRRTLIRVEVVLPC